MKKILSILIIILVLSSCTSPKESFHKQKTDLGTIQDSNGDMVLLLNTNIVLTSVNDDLKDELVNTATSKISEYHKLLDSHHYYLDNSGNPIVNIKTLNDSIGKGPQHADPIIIDCLEKAISLTKLTKGYFNISLGELSKQYSDKLLPYDSTNTDPDKAIIDNLVKGVLPYTDIDNYVIIDKDNKTIELKERDFPYSIDLGAFSKGYILDLVAKDLSKYNTSFLLNAGSSSIIAYTAEEEKDKVVWSIAIKDPNDTNGQLYMFTLQNGAISSSGDYERYYFLDNGIRRHHILNPYTGYSENYLRSNTLISNNAGVIDALSTALFNIEDPLEQEEIINNINTFYKDEISYILVKDDYNIEMTKSFKDILVENYTSNKISNTKIR